MLPSVLLAAAVALMAPGGVIACADEYSSSFKPWEDFVSCQAEKEFCATDAKLRQYCRKTCGTCQTVPPPPTPPAPTSRYQVLACVADGVGKPCTPQPVAHVHYMKNPIKQTSGHECEEGVGQKGSMTWADLTLPRGGNKALLVQVTTRVPGQTADRGFFVRPTRLTRGWGRADITSRQGGISNTATFYLAATGQFSVEFSPETAWRDTTQANNFEALLLFVNPEHEVPRAATAIAAPAKSAAASATANSKGGSTRSSTWTVLAANRKYVFKAGVAYDWGRDHVFKVSDNTEVYFEPGSHVRARIVQTEKKVRNVVISGYGTLDQHYTPREEIVGVSDDATRQTVGIFGKNIKVFGVTIINTNPECGQWGYCLNINANWASLPSGSGNDPFDAYEMQGPDSAHPPFSSYKKNRRAHCQLNNMDDSPNRDFSNCPTSHADGQQVSHVKCMAWQMGQDGLNAGKYGTVEDSFVRVVDDAIKPWDSHGIYRNVVIWQLPLGWPINFGWWNWNQPDTNTLVEDIYVIHNQNWMTSGGWPTTRSGQCTIGGVYGSGAVKQGYRLRNIFVETAASCAVGLEISSQAYSRHLTPDGCVGSIKDVKIEGLFFDEPFYQTGGYTNFLQGEQSPRSGCTGDLRGRIENMQIAGLVAGKPLARSDFVVDAATVPGLAFKPAVDPHPAARASYTRYTSRNAYAGRGAAADIEAPTGGGGGVAVASAAQCVERCHTDWSCGCAVYQRATSLCWKRRGACEPGKFASAGGTDVYVRPDHGAAASAKTTTATATTPTTAKPTAAATTEAPGAPGCDQRLAAAQQKLASLRQEVAQLQARLSSATACSNRARGRRSV